MNSQHEYYSLVNITLAYKIIAVILLVFKPVCMYTRVRGTNDNLE